MGTPLRFHPEKFRAILEADRFGKGQRHKGVTFNKSAKRPRDALQMIEPELLLGMAGEVDFHALW